MSDDEKLPPSIIDRNGLGSEGSVVVAWLFPEQTNGWFTYSMADLLRYDAQHGFHIHRPEGGFITLSTGPRIAEARNMIVDRFASGHPSAEWLLMIDSDMTFSPDLVERMLEYADPEEVPVLGALCFSGGRENAIYPTIWRELSVEDGWINIEKVYDYPENTLCKVSATGAACIMIHRKVLAALARPYPKGFGTLQDGKTPNTYPWFSEGLVGPRGQPLGEDVAFCRRCTVLGIPVHVHTGISTGHMKQFEITEERYHIQRSITRPPAPTPILDRAERRRRARAEAKGRVPA